MSIKAKQSGFTLLEVLVAIVVLSLGLLGLAGLQAASLRNNQTAYYRGIATQQALDMADRIRANLVGVRAFNYNNIAAGIPADPGCFTLVGGCSAANMAITDRFQWNTINAALLPAGTGTVTCADGPAGSGCTATTGNWAFDITVMWTEKDMGGAADPSCPFGTPVNTRCFVTRAAP